MTSKEALAEIVNKFAEQMIRANKCYFNATSKTNAIEYLYRTPQVKTLEKELQALDILKNKKVNIRLLIELTREEYNAFVCLNGFSLDTLEQEEYDIVREVLTE